MRSRGGEHRVLADMLVVDLSDAIGGAYTTKLLADAGAEAVRVEHGDGAALRRRVSCGVELADGEDGALFRYLDGGKRSVVLDRTTAGGEVKLTQLLEVADVIVSGDTEAIALYERFPHAIVVALTPFGVDGCWADRPGSDLTVQAWSGSVGGRGDVDDGPTAAGGELAAWVSGAAAAAAVLMAWRSRAGTLVDVSELETAVTIFNGFQTVAYELTGSPSAVPARVTEVPSIEVAKDGWVGFCTLSAAQFAAFAEMIGKPDWASDPDISRIDWRTRQAAELHPAIEAWTRQRTVAEIIDDATSRRLPCAPVGNGETLTGIEQLVQRGSFETNASGGFLQPRPAPRLSKIEVRPPGPAPGIGDDDVDTIIGDRSPNDRGPAVGEWPHPLSGLRVFDMTSFWAGPVVSQLLAAFGAEVIKVESIQRPDGTRLGTSYGVTGDRIWERAPLYHGCNAGKLGITLDLTRPRGQELGRRLLDHCDILIENYTPRVAERFGLLDDRRDDLIVVRMPAWGLDGPWRDRPGFAQTMEQVTGLGWVTGRPDGPPLVPRGPCDPNGGFHGAFATMLAVLHRDRTGSGQVVESALVDAALSIAAEQVVEYEAYGRRLDRIGNRNRHAAPQGVYRAAGDERWVAIAVVGTDQFESLCSVLGRDDWASDGALTHVAERRRRQDELDAGIAAWCAGRQTTDIVEMLRSAGVPTAEVVPPRAVGMNPHLAERVFFETVDHPVVGAVRLPRFPARLSGRRGPFHLRPAPTLGQHTRGVLGRLLAVTDEEYHDLVADGIVGEEPA